MSPSPVSTRVFASLAVAMAMLATVAAATEASARTAAQLFMDVAIGTREEAVNALAEIDGNWEDDYLPMAIETLYLSRRRGTAVALAAILSDKTGQDHGYDVMAWWEWSWNQPATAHPDYPALKSRLYGMIDPAFTGYFGNDRESEIRLDEVVWGGVRQDGIPPLRNPAMSPADRADYLADTDVIFGLSVNGDARAYPKRILAWHEMFVDEVGGVPVAGVYCTLCGSMILYGTEVDGTNHEMGTSGFLFRSNKLMYDKATQSLWNTIWGRPVIGPLVGQDIELERMSVVTTTWGEWRRRHPETRVLSIDTGHRRDYSEGAAYRDYFATDELMFTVPELDGRLANKAEIVGLVFDGGEPLAVSADYLADRPVHHDRVGFTDLVILTDPSGANRVYESGGLRFESYDGDGTARDAEGTDWTLGEDALTAPGREPLARLPSHRAFWFGWYAAYADTRLVK